MRKPSQHTYDYRLSHRAPEKGRSYDEDYARMLWLTYLWKREQRVLDGVLKTYLPSHAIRYLDFACGTGRIAQYLDPRVAKVIAVDISESMLALARQKLPAATILNVDLTHNDILGDALFDMITAFRFFPNAQHALRTAVIQYLAEHLSPNGVLVFNNHMNRTSIRYRIASLRRQQWRTMSNHEVRSLVTSAGLAIAEVHAIGVLPAVERHMLVPSAIHGVVDTIASAFHVAHVFAQDVIFVCKKS